jgi:cobalamin biosynthesis Mg chelatase CobN
MSSILCISSSDTQPTPKLSDNIISGDVREEGGGAAIGDNGAEEESPPTRGRDVDGGEGEFARISRKRSSIVASSPVPFSTVGRVVVSIVVVVVVGSRLR